MGRSSPVVSSWGECEGGQGAILIQRECGTASGEEIRPIWLGVRQNSRGDARL
jgi:hypothetical protein